MINIAILGFGVVGGGITEVVEQNREALRAYCGDEIFVKYILDLRDFPDSPYGDRVVHDINIIASDPEVTVVCEAMGGVNPAYDFSVLLMKNGKSMVTSNKELVSKRGVELCETAAERGVSYMFEASVGGGIPEIRGMRTSLAGDSITAVDGILNGTTNYILTRMKNDGVTFDAALSEAQRLGYAERDPGADINGIDAQRKIMILCAVATGYMADENEVYTETLKNITPMDMNAAARWGGTVKLVGSARISRGHASLYVCPSFVPYSCPLAFVDDVYNGISFTSPVTGDVMYYGRGAGRMPTAGAMVSDVASVASGLAQKEKPMRWQNAPEGWVTPFEELEFSYYVRVKSDDKAHTLEAATLAFGKVKELDGALSGYAEYITPPICEKDARRFFGGALCKAESVIRILK